VISAPRPDDEAARLAALSQYQILDTAPESSFDDLVQLAAAVCEVPIALVSLIDESRQWFKAKVGVDAEETSREIAFCAHAILQQEIMLVPDAAADPRFADNPLVTGDPHIRFYAGAPIETASGHRLGTLCVIDRRPHTLTDLQLDLLKRLSRQVVQQLELRAVITRLSQASSERQFLTQVVDQTQDPTYWLSPAQDFRFVFVNDAACRHYGYSRDELLRMRIPDWNPDLSLERCRENWQRIKRDKRLILETRHRLRSGAIVPVEVRAHYVTVGGEEFIAGTIYDITERKRVEQVLLEKDRHLDAAQAIAHLGSWQWDIGTGAERWSDEFYRIFGYEPQAVPATYDRFLSALHPDDKIRVLTAINAALEQDRAYDMEFRILRPDGGERTLRSRGVVERDEQGKPLRMDGTVLDVTLERQLERERDALTYAIDRGFEGMALLDAAGRYRYMNPAHAAIYGYTVNQLIEKSWRDLYTPETVSLIEREISPLLELQGTWTGELVGRKQDGELFDVEISLARLTAYTHDEGIVLSCTCRDITARKRAEEQFRLVVESSPTGILVADREGRITLVNRQIEDMFGYSRDELIGCAVERLLPIRNRAEHQTHQKAFWREPVTRAMGRGRDLFACRKDGTEFPVEVGLNPLTTSAGVQVLASVVDISERKRIESMVQQTHRELERRVAERTLELTEANRQLRGLSWELVRTQEIERRRLARDLHDEIGQVLTALNINLQIVKAQADGSVDAPLGECLQLSAQLLHQVRQLAVDLRPQLLDELGLEESLRTLVVRQAERNGWEVSFSLAGAAARLSDEMAVTCYRIVQESLTNAARHARAARVSVQLQWGEQALDLVVEDDGAGFDLEAVMTRAGSAAGAGLRGMDERVRLAGGRLSVQSAPQAGCTVRVWLPLALENRFEAVAEVDRP